MTGSPRDAAAKDPEQGPEIQGIRVRSGWAGRKRRPYFARRHEETRELQAAGFKPVLRKARRCLLHRPVSLTDRQTMSLRKLLKHNLKTVRAWLSREDFQRFWEYSSPAWAGKFLDE